MGSNGRPAVTGPVVSGHTTSGHVLTVQPHVGPVDMRTLMTTLVVKLDMVVLGISANTAVLEAVLAQLGQLDQMPAIAERLAAAVAQLEAIKLPPFLTRK